MVPFTLRSQPLPGKDRRDVRSIYHLPAAEKMMKQQLRQVRNSRNTYKECFRVLKNSGYKGYLSLEYEAENECHKGIETSSVHMGRCLKGIGQSNFLKIILILEPIPRDIDGLLGNDCASSATIGQMGRFFSL